MENPGKVKPTVPITYLDKKKEVPPFLIIHGDKDRLVPFGQSVLFCEALKQNDKSVVMYKLDGADHGGSPFWTDEVLKIVDNFLREHFHGDAYKRQPTAAFQMPVLITCWRILARIMFPSRATATSG